jgi:hypothetical protein
MSPEQIFSLANGLALIGWLVLIIAGRLRWAAALVTGALVPLLFAVIYSWLILAHWGETKGGFGTLAGVAALFSSHWLLLAGWIHYLAFDLFIGSWEVRDAAAHGISHFVIIPCLILTFLFGPAGFLLYMVVRLFLRPNLGLKAS